MQGPPSAGKYDMGAICMQGHAERLQALVNDALDKGAEIVGRGSFGNLGEDAVDQFFPPTVIVNVNHTMKLMQEEVEMHMHLQFNFLMFYGFHEKCSRKLNFLVLFEGFWTNNADNEVQLR